MRELGICKNSGRLYGGSSSSGVPITEVVNIFPIRFEDDLIVPTMRECDGYDSLVFKEESFDPITRVKRGSVYILDGFQPQEWRVHDPQRKDLICHGNLGTTAQILDAISYRIHPLTQLRGITKLPQVTLGLKPYTSLWKIIAIETQFDGKPLLTLKSIRSLGVIPDINFGQYSNDAQAKLKTALESVEMAANRFVPLDTVDRCRDALSIVFGDLAGNLTLDLGQGIKKYIEKNKIAAPNRDGQDLISKNADIVRSLHARGKPNESHKHNTRPIDEDDAILALNCLWFVLTELDDRYAR